MGHHKKRNIFLIITGVIAAGLVVLYFSFDTIVERMVRNRLTNLINQTPTRLYDYEFGGLDIHLLTGSVTLNKIGLIPADHVMDSIKRDDNNLRSVVKVTVDEVEMEGFEIREFLKTGAINVDKFIITDPEFFLYINPKKEVKKAEKSDVLSVLLTDKFVSASLNLLEISNGKLAMDYVNDDTQPMLVESINFTLTKATADKETIKEFLPFEFEEVTFSSRGIQMDINEDIRLVSDSVFLDFQRSLIVIDSVQIQPKFSREQFSKRYDVQKQWLAIKVDEVLIEGATFKQFYTDGDLRVEKVSVINANVALYKDKTKPMPPFKKKPLPGSVLRNIPFTLDVDSITVKNALIVINEKSPITQNLSNFTLNDINALITNLTNDSLKKSEDKYMIGNISTKLMNAAKTNVRLEFDLLSPSDEFIASGNVDSVEAAVFNDVLTPMASVKILQGLIHDLDFKFTSNDTLSTGTMALEYEGIKIEVQNADSKRGKKKGFMSFAANSVIKSNNSKSSGKFTEGIINTDRVLEKNVYPYLWHSIESGLVSTLVPITNKKEAKAEQKEIRKELKQEKKSGQL